jgi:hypothetical protein
MNLILIIALCALFLITILNIIPSFGLLFGGNLITMSKSVSINKQLIINTKNENDLFIISGKVDISNTFNNNIKNTNSIKQNSNFKQHILKESNSFSKLLIMNRTGLSVPKIFTPMVYTNMINHTNEDDIQIHGNLNMNEFTIKNMSSSGGDLGEASNENLTGRTLFWENGSNTGIE